MLICHKTHIPAITHPYSGKKNTVLARNTHSPRGERQKKRETGAGNCIPGRLSPFGIMQSYAGGKPCDQNINMLFYKHLAYCSV